EGEGTPAEGEDTAADPDAKPYPDLPTAELVALMQAQIRRDADDPTAMGAVDAPVVIAEWADYRCGYCQQFAIETIPGIQHYIDDGLVRIEWNDFPVFQEESLDLAVAAQAAGEQGLFREMNHAIMEYQAVDGGTDLSRENILALAGSIAVPDLAAFEAALDSEEILAAVNASYENAMTVFGRAATPQFIVNYQYIGGFLDAEAMSRVIDQELLRIADNG
ncbi:MAG: thioredoxin domain-containing protein, partial [Ruaniaceae bacterium]|nr:thioredoxin domain-containing protein [Ruaniaceae bacterium]